MLMKHWLIFIGVLLSITISTSLYVAIQEMSVSERNQSENLTQYDNHSLLSTNEPPHSFSLREKPLHLQARSGEVRIKSPLIKAEGISVDSNKSATILTVSATIIIIMFVLRLYGRKRKSNL